MPDIRLVRPRNSHVWAWTGTLSFIAVAIWLASTLFLGDRTASAAEKKVGARANFGADRGAVLPLRTETFESALPLEDRELGRMLQLSGTAESPLRRSGVYVRSRGGERVLVRFEPEPATPLRIGPGSGVRVSGYLQKIARAEFDAWMDTLGVVIPRPRPGVKFGDLPDSTFARVDSLFIKDYYLSVRPEGIGGFQAPPPAPAAAPARPASPATGDSAPAALPSAPAATPPAAPDTATTAPPATR